MGKGGSGYHTSRAEFLTDDVLNGDLRYSRNGGCFVTTKKAMTFVILAVLSLILVVLLMYYYGPNRQLEMFQNETNDIEKLINETVNEKVPEEDLRLPRKLFPINYRLWLYPILDEDTSDNFTFTGKVKILIHCIKKTDQIVLHWDDLNINDSDITISTTKLVKIKPEAHVTESTQLRKRDAETETEMTIQEDGVTTELPREVVTVEISSTNETLNNPNEVYTLVNSTETVNVTEQPEEVLISSEIVSLEIDQITRDEQNFKLIISMKEYLGVGENYTVTIKFAGQILNNLVGLYKTSYTDLSGNVRWLATTHFQPVYARRVFPCFDEPSFKATFEISIARRTNMTVLSNMPLKETEPMNETGWVWDHFMKSVPMSTYVVAFTISDFESMKSNSTSPGPLLSVWAPKDDLEKARYALSVVEDILPFLENYFGIKYPLPKLDMLVIPNFPKIGMENWGLISFSESALLFNARTRTIRTRSYIFNVIAHELSHQWFGNLVTMKWWSDLWLNEGFGAFMAEIVQIHLRPHWQVYSSFQLGDRYEVLQLDGLKTTGSIQKEIVTHTQIDQIFDEKIYEKGSALLKMLNYTLGREVFQKGLQDYLEKFSYQSTTQDDLWEIFTNSAQKFLPINVTVKTIMNTWTTQNGHPYITVERDYSSRTAILNQSKITDGNVTTDTLWYVPISYSNGNDESINNIWLEKKRTTMLNISDVGNNTWLLVNIDEKGFYRVNYDMRNWRLLQFQLRRHPERIPVSNRGQLIDDAFQLAWNGLLNYSVPFGLVKYLNLRETNYIPWYSALRNMETLRIIIRNYEYSGLYDNFMYKLIKPVFSYLTTEDKPNDTQNSRLLRLHLVKTACKLRDSVCIAWTKKKYREWMDEEDPDKRNPIPVDYRYIVECNAVKSGGLDEWNFLWNRTLIPAIEPADLETAYLSLGCTHDPWLINKYLELALDGNITIENVRLVWKSINHPVGVRIGFQFLRLNWDRIYKAYEEVYPVFSTIFSDFITQLTTQIDLEDLTTFYKLHQNDLKSVSTILQGTVDQMKLRINWNKNHLSDIIAWLKENKFQA